MTTVAVEMLVKLSTPFNLGVDTCPLPVTFPTRSNGANVAITINERCRVSEQSDAVDKIHLAFDVEVPPDISDRIVLTERPSADVKADVTDPKVDACYRTLFRVAVGATNTLLRGLRALADCWWLNEIEAHDDFIGNFFRRVRIEFRTGGAVCWWPLPPYPSVMFEGKTILGAEKLKHVADRIQYGRVPLPLEVVSNAERHWYSGHLRAAVVEAVSALEVGIAQFGSNADLARLDQTAVTRLAAPLGKILGDAGLRLSTRLILPLLLTEETADDYVLSTVVEAVDLRNEIVHNGKRNLDRDDVENQIAAIRELLEALPTVVERQVATVGSAEGPDGSIDASQRGTVS